MLASLFLGAQPANAGHQICNKSSNNQFYVTSYVENSRSYTQGWFKLLPGECNDFNGLGIYISGFKEGESLWGCI